MKIAKKVLKTIGVLLGFIVVIVLGYIIYLYASYHRIEDNKSLSVESHTETKQTLTTGKQYSAITYNIGFGAYTPDFSFVAMKTERGLIYALFSGTERRLARMI